MKFSILKDGFEIWEGEAEDMQEALFKAGIEVLLINEDEGIEVPA